MSKRTFAIGDIHGDVESLERLVAKLPSLREGDTLVFLGDYVDRGPHSREVIDYVREKLPKKTRATIVALRGNHEDGWLRVSAGGWPEFVMPPPNGCLATLRSFTGRPYEDGDVPTREEFSQMLMASFFPDDVLEWMEELPFFYEDEQAIYVHAGLVKEEGRWLHPREVANKSILLWVRTMEFFRDYDGKRVVCGHTTTEHLPPELSQYTPEDPLDMWVRDPVLAIDTGCGKGGFLTAIELPALRVYESRDGDPPRIA